MDVPTPLAYAVPVPLSTAPQGDDNSTYTSASASAPPRRDGLMSSKQPSQSFRIPAASPNTLNNPSAASLTEYQISQLVQQGYTRGLAHAMGNNIVTFPLRYWVVDYSGSMAATDGKRLIAPSRKHKAGCQNGPLYSLEGDSRNSHLPCRYGSAPRGSDCLSSFE